MAQQITVIGLGSGDENQLTLGIYRLLQKAKQIYLRTDQHPVADWLRTEGIQFESFDGVYEEYESFDEVYQVIVGRLVSLALASDGEIVYAVPGHPMVAEKTTRLLKQRCPEHGLVLRIAGGESFLDEAFLRLGLDPIEGFSMVDAADLERIRINPRLHTIIAQVYDSMTASDVKLSLMEQYPDSFEVVVGHALGIDGQERIHRVPLYELDRLDDYGNLSLVWVPRSTQDEVLNRSFDRLHEIVEILRSPGGCPWDREQTHKSIRKNLIEETYEVLETIDDDDPEAMCEELGDLMLQVLLHSQIEQETGIFSVYDVVAVLNEKLIRRHPHVFGERSAADADEALTNWQQVKLEEKKKKGIDVRALSVLSGVPRDLPAVLKAWELQRKAAKVGFDWNRAEEVVDKIREELEELLAEMSSGDAEKQKDELGDLLFAVVNLARFLHIDPEEALALTNLKFTKRFTYIEEQLSLKGKSFDHTSLLEMEEYWREAKNLLKN